MSAPPDYKRRALEFRQAHLNEEYKAANAQLSRALSDVDRLRLQRTADDLERQIGKIDAQLQGTSASELLSMANPPAPESPALTMTRRALAIVNFRPIMALPQIL